MTTTILESNQHHFTTMSLNPTYYCHCQNSHQKAWCSLQTFPTHLTHQFISILFKWINWRTDYSLGKDLWVGIIVGRTSHQDVNGISCGVLQWCSTVEAVKSSVIVDIGNVKVVSSGEVSSASQKKRTSNILKQCSLVIHLSSHQFHIHFLLLRVIYISILIDLILFFFKISSNH